ncbi:MAG: ATP-binding protein [Candidatus Dadabacteria bacterium]|nr:MAG: ATP-binding protein [Candidatus Dadabacteria bacterium]
MTQLKNIVAVASGKGGVGKSTVAANLAVALAAHSKQVALIDADFYGPSIPLLFGGGKIEADHQGKIIPPLKFGVKYISLQFFLENPDDPVIWRGPMFTKALHQLFYDVNWGAVDYCIVDMPPGTGDAQLSLAQMVQLSGALIVTTPQEMALADVRKAINMLSRVNVDVLGIVENMAGFVAPDGQRYDIFGSGGGKKLADAFNVPLLASIPVDPRIREAGDSGEPIAAAQEDACGHYQKLALRLIEILAEREQAGEGSLKIVSQ